jgi:hypothetical protein
MAQLTDILKRKPLQLKASSLLETVFAMVIIAVMLIIGSNVYTVVTRSKSTLQEINEQGMFFSTVLQTVYIKEEQEISWEGNYTYLEEVETEMETHKVIRLKSERGKVLNTYALFPPTLTLD